MIESDLKRVGELIPKGSLIVVHAKVKGLFDYNYGYSFCSLKLLDGIRNFLSPDQIFVPTFTYSFTNTQVLDVKQTPSEVGRFSEEIRRHFIPNQNRTIDPIFSVIETEQKYKAVNSPNLKAFSKESVWHYLHDKPHFILNINLGIPIVSTQLHYLEYEHSVPYRYIKNFKGKIIDWQGSSCNLTYEYFVRDLIRNPQWNRPKISKHVQSKGALLECGAVRVFDWIKLKEVLTKKMSKNKEYLIL